MQGVFGRLMLRAFLGVFSAGRFWAFNAQGVFGRFYALGVSGRFYTETPSKKAFSGVSPLPMYTGQGTFERKPRQVTLKWLQRINLKAYK